MSSTPSLRHLLLAASLASLSLAASSYPAPGTVGPAPLDSWVSTYNAAKAAGKIPGIPPSVMVDGLPSYPAGVSPCSWTVSHCFGPEDVHNAPDGMWSLNFDDGVTQSSPELSTFLASENLLASRFLIGSNVYYYPQNFQTALENGDHLAVHTWSHPYITTLTDLQVIGELGWSAQIISDYSGGLVPLFWRPPEGDVDDRVRAIAKEVFGLTTILWNADSSDWCLQENGRNACPNYGPESDAGLDAELQRFMTGPKSPGLIVLEHELTSRSIGGFMRNYPTLVANGWDVRNVPDLWGSPWYQNAQKTRSTWNTSMGIGLGLFDGTFMPGYSTSSSSSSSSSSTSSTSTLVSTSSTSTVPPPSSTTTTTSSTTTPTTVATPVISRIVTNTTMTASASASPSTRVTSAQSSSGTSTRVVATGMGLVVVAFLFVASF